MSKKIFKSLSIILGVFIFLIIYLSTVGIETKKFNKKIQDLVRQKNHILDTNLKKIKLTLDPLNFKINAKTIDVKVTFKGKPIKLEYIKIQIPLNSLIKRQLIASQIEISTKSILLKNFVSLIRSINNRPELFFLEQFVKKGYLVADLKLNFDKFGALKEDYIVKGLLRDGKVSFFKKYQLDKINFLFDVRGNNFNFEDISFKANDINFLSERLNIKKNKKDYFFEGSLSNDNSSLSPELLNIIKLKYPLFNLINTNFKSKNDFSFNINNKFKVKNLAINSSILINRSQFKKNSLINNNFMKINDLVDFKDHKIKASYSNNELSIEGNGQVKIQNKFEFIDYIITNKGSDLNLISNLNLSELDFKNQSLIKEYLPETNNILSLKDQKIKIDFKKNILSLKGSGKIKLQNELNKVEYFFLSNGGTYNFETDLEINDTNVDLNFINYTKDKNLKSRLEINGSYNKKKGINFQKIIFLSKKNNFIINDLIIDRKNKIVKVDKIDLDYLDNSDKQNKFVFSRTKKNDYKINGSLFNAESLISKLIKSKEDQKFDIFNEDIKIKLNFSNVYLDKYNFVKDLNGNLQIVDNKIYQVKISAIFDNNKDFKFTINTNKNDEKITTLYSSKAKPLVNRYKFIKGFKDGDEGYLDFYSTKKDRTSNSKLIIDNFKIKEIPVLAKLLALASLQGIADLLTGEGIRFTDFEMNFTNKDKLMTIQELYAIGPAISILIEGYIEEDNLISLRGTLVPATTINRSIASIPLLGDLLIGKKVGEGVFGVSFKVKGPPENLKTTVNPVKTLTPRFITRTLEKIKKN
jgi:hypothetical protein